MRHFLEHLVAHCMTQGVIDRFESIHVQVQYRQWRPLRLVQVFAEAIEQAVAVGQPGQRVVQERCLICASARNSSVMSVAVPRKPKLPASMARTESLQVRMR